MDYTLPFLWLLNGFLALAYIMFEHLLSLLMLGPLIWMYTAIPGVAGEFYSNRLRPALLLAAAISLTASILAPMPVPFALFLMALVGSIVFKAEKYRPDEAMWTMARGMILYSLVGIGYFAFSTYLELVPPSYEPGTQGVLVKGQQYLSVIIAIALYGSPILYIGYLLKGFLAHPPSGDPMEIVDTVRTGGLR